MAIDVYLQIDGIKGESLDDRHRDWIECTSVQWGVSQPRSATASTSGGHTAERCEHQEVMLTKLADLSSPILLQTCSAGKTIPKAKFEFMRADGQGERVKYFEIELENVLIGGVAPNVAEGSIIQEQVGLKFSKIKWKYTQQKIGGGTGGNTSGGWDLAANKIV
ncbi:Hcp family type VI secretion system effector [Massilia niastensis]|uniref:Hcp family type VI secretion system effector n=1 Tax=Massilia niastensis TaxID=544911 RepID=UPI0003634C84|nr:type VI secretion system tube protein Hcp [Massilia niastensis]